MSAVEAENGIGRCICDAGEISLAIDRLAALIAADHRRQPLLLLGVLKGALCFAADLARALAGKADGPSEIMVDYVGVERYGSLGSTGGAARLTMDSSLPVTGVNIVVLDDIVDNGRTLTFVHALLEERRPAAIRTCVLFDRPARREVDVTIDYAGIVVPNVFVIGYGLDYKEQYRNLPYLAELREGQTV